MYVKGFLENLVCLLFHLSSLKDVFCLSILLACSRVLLSNSIVLVMLERVCLN